MFIATSLDGCIADRNNKIDWLYSIPNPHNIDMGYNEFISEIDALIMGRITYETVRGFDIEWPYEKPVYVLSTKLNQVPEELIGKVEIVNGKLKEVLTGIHKKGHLNLYIDGGKTIQSFLKEDLIDEITITIIPHLLGGGVKLFTELQEPLKFECVDSKIYLNKVVQNRFERKR